MQFVCSEHGAVDPVTVDGYTMGHRTERLTEHDLEGVEFTIESPAPGEPLEPRHVIADAEPYMTKFADWREQVVAAFSEYDAIDLGVICPDCGHFENMRLEQAEGEE